MDAILGSPAILAILIGAIGSGITWCWSQYSKAKQSRRDEIVELQRRVGECETERALLRRQVAEHDGALKTLTKLIKKEVNIG